jgi:hypothetical protein
MELSDGSHVCVDCTQPFTIDDGERRFFEQRGFAMPKRCPACRQQKRRLKDQQQQQNDD